MQSLSISSPNGDKIRNSYASRYDAASGLLTTILLHYVSHIFRVLLLLLTSISIIRGIYTRTLPLPSETIAYAIPGTACAD